MGINTPRDEKMIIIGAGIGGLAAGIFALKQGFRVRILEKHFKPGGLSTNWQRKDYRIEGCIHHIAGLNPSTRLHQLWKEVGAFENTVPVFHSQLVQIDDAAGKSLHIHDDYQELEEHLLSSFPDDISPLKEYLSAIWKFRKIDLMDMPVNTLLQNMGMMFRGPLMAKWGSITDSEFAQRFSHPLLKNGIPLIPYDIAGVPMIIQLSFINGVMNHNMGGLIGSGQKLTDNMARRFTDMGGEIVCNSRVTKILIKDDKAVGVEIDSYAQENADLIVSAIDGYTTVNSLLEAKYMTPKLKRYFQHIPDEQDMNVHVSFGVKRPMTEVPYALTWLLEEPMKILNRTQKHVSMENFAFDTELHSPGKTVLKILLKSKYSFWKELKANGDAYRVEKEKIADTLKTELNRKFPGIAEDIEHIDVATPLTVERFTGNIRGLQPWMLPDAGMSELTKSLYLDLPGLKNFYATGHWSKGMFGLSTVLAQGKKTVEHIVKTRR